MYLHDKPLADDVDVHAVARGTPGFNGAGRFILQCMIFLGDHTGGLGWLFLKSGQGWHVRFFNFCGRTYYVD